VRQTPFELAHEKEWQAFEAFLEGKNSFDAADLPARFRRVCQALALAGVGTAWFLGANGLILGAVAGYLTQAGFSETFWSFVAGHSSFELVAIMLSGAAGFRLGLAVIAPGNRSRKAALVAAAKPAVRVMYGAAVLFLIAAFVEAFWSPLTELGYTTKVAVGIAGWLALAAYFLLAGRSRAAR
jgi:hypothetical protein